MFYAIMQFQGYLLLYRHKFHKFILIWNFLYRSEILFYTLEHVPLYRKYHMRKIRIYAKLRSMLKPSILESSKLSFVQATRDRWQLLCGRWIKFLSVTIILSCVCCDGIIILSLTRPLTIVCTGRPFIIVEDYVAGSATNALQWMRLTNLNVFIFTTKIAEGGGEIVILKL